MEENIFDASGFLVTFPLWLPGVFTPKIEVLLEARHPDGDRAVVVFMDEPAAEAFLRSGIVPPAFSLKRVADPLTLLGLLLILERKGITHVAFDPTPGGTKNSSITIPALRQHALGWLE